LALNIAQVIAHVGYSQLRWFSAENATSEKRHFPEKLAPDLIRGGAWCSAENAAI
jgi:hypothetical protein